MKIIFIKKKVMDAREKYNIIDIKNYFYKKKISLNRDIPYTEIDKVLILEEEAREFFHKISESKQFQLSVRSYHRILKVARTIADLDYSDNIKKHHLTESLSYRF